MPLAALFEPPKSIIDTACCASIFQSSTPTRVLATYWMMLAPPGEPVVM